MSKENIQKAQQAIDRLLDTLRQFDEYLSREHIVSITKEIKNLKSFIALEKSNTEKNLTSHQSFEIDEDVKAAASRRRFELLKTQ